MTDEFAFLRKLSERQDMRKKLIGGVSEEDVDTMINNIQEFFREREQEYRKDLEELQLTKDQLKEELDKYKLNSRMHIDDLQSALKKYQKDFTLLEEEKKVMVTKLNEEHSLEINKLKDENLDLKEQLKKSVLANSDLNTRLSTLESKQALKDDLIFRISQLENSLKEAKGQLDQSLADNEFLKEHIKEEKQFLVNDYQMRLEEHVNKNVFLEEQLKEKEDFIELQRKDYEKSLKILEDKLNNRSSANSASIEIHTLYRQLEQIKDQVILIENLQKQLEIERARSVKAENDINQLCAFIEEMKERFSEDKKALEIKLLEIQEKQKIIESDVNSFNNSLFKYSTLDFTEIDNLIKSRKQGDLKN
jgi:chromosome segregation ATPase